MARGEVPRWDEVFQLEPCRDLPSFALVAGHAMEERTLEVFLRAHHCACFYGVLVDRIADHQVKSSPEFMALAQRLCTEWKRSLVELTKDEVLAEEAISQSMRAWRLGVALERTALSRRGLSPRRYARLVLLKLGWAELASDTLLHLSCEPGRARLFRHATFALMLGLQCLDDAVDAPEDAALRGVDIPAALGVPRAQLFRAGVWLTRAAASPARQGGFERFARWLADRADAVSRLHPEGSSLDSDLGGYALASLLEETCRHSAACFSTRSVGITSSERLPSRPGLRNSRSRISPLSVP